MSEYVNESNRQNIFTMTRFINRPHFLNIRNYYLKIDYLIIFLFFLLTAKYSVGWIAGTV